ncbi:hypothetical protein BaRGS_00015180 [Batillaria attramentaria]|uniref:Uncharacterized protein n=1 Tax=Batillaria attramentaria TaxID=370345 RepID=A0ABD0L370_9CAEN
MTKSTPTFLTRSCSRVIEVNLTTADAVNTHAILQSRAKHIGTVETVQTLSKAHCSPSQQNLRGQESGSRGCLRTQSLSMNVVWRNMDREKQMHQNRRTLVRDTGIQACQSKQSVGLQPVWDQVISDACAL